MRFTSERQLGPSEWVDTPEAVARLAQTLETYEGFIGFDTETDGLGYVVHRADKDDKFAGDGLGAELQVLCLAFDDRRIAVPTYGKYRAYADVLVPLLHKRQSQLACFNSIFDFNVVEYSMRHLGLEFTTFWADGLKLWYLWDEDAEDTHHLRNLKVRSRFWLGLPMNSFDDLILKNGGIRQALENPSTFHQALDYCTRDAVAHLGLCTLGSEIAKTLPWCVECPHCGQPAAQRSLTNPDKHFCPEHGWVTGTKMLTMWDWHVRKDRQYMLVLKRMEQRGILLDADPLTKAVDPLRQAAAAEYALFQKEVNDALREKGAPPAEVNPNSGKQLARVFHGDYDLEGNRIGLGLPVTEYTDTGAIGTGQRALDKLMVKYGAPGIKRLKRYRALNKILSTYAQAMLDIRWDMTGRIHTRVRPDTVTGRLSSNGPNMQNLPAYPIFVTLPPAIDPPEITEESANEWGMTVEEMTEHVESAPEFQPVELEVNIRNSMIAPEGRMLVCADYAQLEVRLAAMESDDENLIKVINDGLDMHSFTAAKAYSDLVPDLTYDYIYAAKQWGDEDRLPRFQRAWRLASPEGDELKDFEAAFDRLHKPEADELRRDLERAQRAAEYIVGQCGSVTDWGEFEALEAELDPVILQGYYDILTFQDGRLIKYRKGAKSAIFGILYGIGPTGLAVQITDATGEICSVDDAKDLIHGIRHVAYPGLGKMGDSLKDMLRENGFVRTRMGRYRHPQFTFSGDSSKVARAMRQCINTPIQGLAADMMQNVMTALEFDDEWNDLGGKLLMQVHDELLGSAPKEVAKQALERMIYVMEECHGLDAPVRFKATGGLAGRWGEIK
jgi:DNA polymerase I-like protein with 3'-5' exonuclease and polymerase domains